MPAPSPAQRPQPHPCVPRQRRAALRRRRPCRAPGPRTARRQNSVDLGVRRARRGQRGRARRGAGRGLDRFAAATGCEQALQALTGPPASAATTTRPGWRCSTCTARPASREVRDRRTSITPSASTARRPSGSRCPSAGRGHGAQPATRQARGRRQRPTGSAPPISRARPDRAHARARAAAGPPWMLDWCALDCHRVGAAGPLRAVHSAGPRGRAAALIGGRQLLAVLQERDARPATATSIRSGGSCAWRRCV